VLSGLAAVGALTALVAGIAGAWSPCGFSMVDTIGTALGDARRAITVLAVAAFTLGALAGGVITFGGLSLLGSLVGHGSRELRDTLAALLALAAAVADWRGWRIAPQIRRQVPERWRWIMPLPLAATLYGVLLGLGFTTFVLAFAVWALAAISVASGSLALGIVVGVAFGLGRALPVAWIAPRLRTPAGEAALERLALEPRLWLGMRRLDALGLGACAALLGASSALAAGGPSYATDPSVDGAAIVWQQPGGSGVLERASHRRVLRGVLPAVGGGNLAYVTANGIEVARGFKAPLETIPLPLHARVDGLAISTGWVVVRDAGRNGVANLFAVSLGNPLHRVYINGSATPGAIGRPSVERARVVYAYSTAVESRIELINLSTGHRSLLRRSTRDDQFADASISFGRLLYVRTDRCSQQLVLGSPSSAGHDRVLLTLASTVLRDPGWQVGYTHAYNEASLCTGRSARAGGTITLGATALGRSAAYVSESPADVAHTRIVRLSLSARG
jgi:hypothetical protein